MKKIFLFTLFVLNFIFIGLTNASACSCMVPGSLTEELNNSKEVFVGKVIDIKKDKLSYDLDSINYQKIITFDISKRFKGGKISNLMTSSNSAMCGYNFEEGKEYIVYTSGDDDKSYVSLCSKTALLKDNKDILELEKLYKNKDSKSMCLEKESQCNICSRKSLNESFACTRAYCEDEAFTCKKYAKSEVIGGSKDNYGCLISAGYSWSHLRQSCIRIYESKLSSTDYKKYTQLIDDISPKIQKSMYISLKKFKKNLSNYSINKREVMLKKVINKIENMLLTMDFDKGNKKAQKIYDIIELLLLEIKQIDILVKNSDNVKDCGKNNGGTEQCKQ